MVSLTTIRASNALIKSTLPARLVGVFVGGTSGIGSTTLLQFAKHTAQPTAYIVGRSRAAAESVISECRELNPRGVYRFIAADVSLIHVVDDVCEEIREGLRSDGDGEGVGNGEGEGGINILFCTAGVIDLERRRTSEGLDLTFALTIYSRARFITNLLPLLAQAPSLRRVVTVFAGTKEGPLVSTSDLDCSDASLFKIRSIRGHMCSMIDFSLEAIAASTTTKDAPSNVSFIHDYPGFVDTGIFDKTPGPVATAMRAVGKVADLLVPARKARYIPLEECGERHLYLATSARYEPADRSVSGVPIPVNSDGDGGGEEIKPARGSTGEVGSGVYVIDEDLESASSDVEQLLGKMRKDGMVEKVWRHMEGQFERITGATASS